VEPKPYGQETITPPRFATSVYGVLDPFDETLQLASAGHLPVLVRRPDGTVDVVSAPPGPPLGLALGPFEEIVTPFPAGSVLVAFTDGLVESRDVDLDVGIARLAAELEKVVPDGDLEVAADRLLAAAGPAGGQDDVALVLLRVTAAAAPSARAQWVLAGLADTAVARRVVRDLARGAVPDRVDEAVQVASELAANALEHGAPPVRLRVHATAHRLVIAATDTSALAPRPTVAGVEDERGRGLAIVSRLSDAWGVRLSRSGKTTWAEFLTEAGRADRAGRDRSSRDGSHRP
jgi:anti-sigma regulatory factor (Ser/Thr protein kinase)